MYRGIAASLRGLKGKVQPGAKKRDRPGLAVGDGQPARALLQCAGACVCSSTSSAGLANGGVRKRYSDPTSIERVDPASLTLVQMKAHRRNIVKDPSQPVTEIHCRPVSSRHA